MRVYVCVCRPIYVIVCVYVYVFVCACSYVMLPVTYNRTAVLVPEVG